VKPLVDYQARSQDLLATRAMPMLSSHADGGSKQLRKKIIFRSSGQPGAVLWATEQCPGLPMPGYGPVDYLCKVVRIMSNLLALLATYPRISCRPKLMSKNSLLMWVYACDSLRLSCNFEEMNAKFK
jgi:hypothetical protein